MQNSFPRGSPVHQSVRFPLNANCLPAIHLPGASSAILVLWTILRGGSLQDSRYLQSPRVWASTMYSPISSSRGTLHDMLNPPSTTSPWPQSSPVSFLSILTYTRVVSPSTGSP